MPTDRSFRAVFLTIAFIGTITWLAIFEHNYHPRIYRYSEDVTILQEGVSWTSSVQREGSISGGTMAEPPAAIDCWGLQPRT